MFVRLASRAFRSACHGLASGRCDRASSSLLLLPLLIPDACAPLEVPVESLPPARWRMKARQRAFCRRVLKSNAAASALEKEHPHLLARTFPASLRRRRTGRLRSAMILLSVSGA